jgi:Fic family protein
MNFAQMLATEVKPQRLDGHKTWTRNTKVANVVVQSKAIRKYTAAVSRDWTKTVDIATRLGMERMSVFKQLAKYVRLGILERRPLGGRPFNQHTGWEWRVK